MTEIFVGFVIVFLLNVVVLYKHRQGRDKLPPHTYKFFSAMYSISLILAFTGALLLALWAR